MQGRLSEQQIREVLARAEELHLQTPPGEPSGAEMEAIVAAAEEAGLSRDSVLQALRERLDISSEPPKLGERVFAKSADGKLYAADVLDVREGTVRVRFLKGGEHTVSVQDTQPCSLVPGQRVVCPWPDWGWWTCTAVSYNAEKGKVKATDGWGSTETFSIADVRLDPPRAPRQSKPMPRLKFFLYTLAMGAALGGGLAGVLVWLLMR